MVLKFVFIVPGALLSNAPLTRAPPPPPSSLLRNSSVPGRVRCATRALSRYASSVPRLNRAVVSCVRRLVELEGPAVTGYLYVLGAEAARAVGEGRRAEEWEARAGYWWGGEAGMRGLERDVEGWRCGGWKGWGEVEEFGILPEGKRLGVAAGEKGVWPYVQSRRLWSLALGSYQNRETTGGEVPASLYLAIARNHGKT